MRTARFKKKEKFWHCSSLHEKCCHKCWKMLSKCRQYTLEPTGLITSRNSELEDSRKLPAIRSLTFGCKTRKDQKTLICGQSKTRMLLCVYTAVQNTHAWLARVLLPCNPQVTQFWGVSDNFLGASEARFLDATTIVKPQAFLVCG